MHVNTKVASGKIVNASLKTKPLAFWEPELKETKRSVFTNDHLWHIENSLFIIFLLTWVLDEANYEQPVWNIEVNNWIGLDDNLNSLNIYFSLRQVLCFL